MLFHVSSKGFGEWVWNLNLGTDAWDGVAFKKCSLISPFAWCWLAGVALLGMGLPISIQLSVQQLFC